MAELREVTEFIGSNLKWLKACHALTQGGPVFALERVAKKSVILSSKYCTANSHHQGFKEHLYHQVCLQYKYPIRVLQIWLEAWVNMMKDTGNINSLWLWMLWRLGCGAWKIKRISGIKRDGWFPESLPSNEIRTSKKVFIILVQYYSNIEWGTLYLIHIIIYISQCQRVLYFIQLLAPLPRPRSMKRCRSSVLAWKLLVLL